MELVNLLLQSLQMMRDFLVFLLPLVRGQNITLQNVVLYFLQLRTPLHLHEHL